MEIQLVLKQSAGIIYNMHLLNLSARTYTKFIWSSVHVVLGIDLSLNVQKINRNTRREKIRSFGDKCSGYFMANKEINYF
jgi:hypothetical protein